ncbi:MAG: GMC family oxidoreductase [Pseudoclavibacter sp.]
MRAVVVGAGSAGCAVAGRLAERGHDVVLIESGPDWRSESAPAEIRHPRDDIFAWRVDGRSPSRFAAPDVTAERFVGAGPEPYLRGRGMGGTSAVNGLVAIRPSVDDFVHWGELGCEGWGWDDVLPLFRRLEDDRDFGQAPYHGVGGPVPIVRREVSEWGSGDRLLSDAAIAAGHAWEPDYHRPGALGVSRTASHMRLGVRVTSYDGYVERWRNCGRITVIADLTVARVVVEHGRASGVEGTDARGARVRIEGDAVVLASGAASTPALLQRSGIGPAAFLDSLGIRAIADLPVGAGMQDHVGFWLAVPHEGSLPGGAGARGNVTLRASSGLEHSRPGDLLVVAANPAGADAGETAFGVKLGRCMSTGRLRLRSRDARVGASIEMRLLSDARDRALARHAVRWATDLLASDGHEVVDRHGRRVDLGMSDADADAWVRECARDTSHLTGGACMGAGDDAVTDSRLRVKGIEGLVVADLSVCPVVPRANTYLTAVMIGERAADVLAPED